MSRSEHSIGLAVRRHQQEQDTGREWERVIAPLEAEASNEVQAPDQSDAEPQGKKPWWRRVFTRT